MAEFNSTQQNEIKQLAQQVLRESGTPIENFETAEGFASGDVVPFLKKTGSGFTRAKIAGTSIGSGSGSGSSESGSGTTVTIDSELSGTSTNPVQNKVIKEALDGKAPTSRKVNNKPLTADITLEAGDVGALPSNTNIPSKLSDLDDDAAHRVVTDTEKTTWNNKQAALVSGTNIKTINGSSILGSGNIQINGSEGQTGADGKSAYQSYLDTTTDSPVKTEAEWVASLKGEQGTQGVKGDKGDKGDTGEKGEKGDKGDQGIQGIQGPAGTNGTNGTSVTITSTSTQYQTSSSGTTIPTGTWQNSVPSVTKGQYLWTRTIVNYSDGKSTTSYSVAYQGQDGTNASLTVDSALSTSSTNPVQNKVIANALNSKVPTSRTINGKALTSNIALNKSDVGLENVGILTPGSLLETVDNYYENDYIGEWGQQNIKGSAYLYEIGNTSTINYSASGSPIPNGIRLLYYDKDLFLIDKTDKSTATQYTVPSGAVYVSFILYYDASQIASINSNLKNISFSFLANRSIYIDDDLKYPKKRDDGAVDVNLGDISPTYIEGDPTDSNYGKYFQYDDYQNASICIPYSQFKRFDYVEVLTQSGSNISRIHFLKKEPTTNGETVVYSDYYKENVRIEAGNNNTIFYKIPDDARFIMIYTHLNFVSRTPRLIRLRTAESLGLVNMDDDEMLSSATRNPNQYSFKLIHWNIGNFSNGGAKTSITSSNYSSKLSAFNSFLNTYKDYNIVLNEFNKVFAELSSGDVNTWDVLFGNYYYRNSYVRVNAWDELAVAATNTLCGHKVGVLSSLAGMSNGSYYIMPRPYVIYRHFIGGDFLYVLHTHLPTQLSASQHQTVFSEMVSLMSGYKNAIICGDMNLYSGSRSTLSVFTNAGYTVANNSTNTYPSSGNIYDYIIYKGNFTNVSFKVCTDAVDGNGDMLSDHWPIAITLEYTGSSIVPAVRGANRYNPTTNEPEWYDGKNWNVAGIKLGSASGTTSANGNMSVSFSRNTIILSAWTSKDSAIVYPYPGSGNGYTNGRTQWWFHLVNDSASQSAITSTSVTIYYAYIET